MGGRRSLRGGVALEGLGGACGGKGEGLAVEAERMRDRSMMGKEAMVTLDPVDWAEVLRARHSGTRRGRALGPWV